MGLLYRVFSKCSHVATKGDEGHEGYEGRQSRKGCEAYDGNCCVQVCGGVDRLENEGRERNGGSNVGRCCNSAEEVWRLQDCRRAQLETEAEACDASAKGCKSIHEGALRFQGQACVQDSESTSYEETESLGELVRSP